MIIESKRVGLLSYPTNTFLDLDLDMATSLQVVHSGTKRSQRYKYSQLLDYTFTKAYIICAYNMYYIVENVHKGKNVHNCLIILFQGHTPSVPILLCIMLLKTFSKVDMFTIG